jgi:hypothetical protein
MKMKMKDQMKDVHPAKRIRNLLLPVPRRCFRCRIGSPIMLMAVQILEGRCPRRRELIELATFAGRASLPL